MEFYPAKKSILKRNSLIESKSMDNIKTKSISF